MTKDAGPDPFLPAQSRAYAAADRFLKTLTHDELEAIASGHVGLTLVPFDVATQQRLTESLQES